MSGGNEVEFKKFSSMKKSLVILSLLLLSLLSPALAEKVYENMMVDLQMTNKKLVERSKRIVMTITGVDYETAESVLTSADGHVKTALVMILRGVDKSAAKRLLAEADGFVRAAIES